MTKLIDIQTLSVLLSVKQKTIYDWVHKNAIPYVKLGRLVRFDENEIKRWLENKKVNKPLRRAI
ncbi:MAG: helix-turn-helix domain-containing protein [candidate division WOR-3 bacterium]